MDDKNRNIICLFGGTFDPIHNAHLYVAESVFKELPCKEIRFLPCYTPVHRDKPQASAEQRLQMLDLALSPYYYMSIDKHEVNRQGPSYMIDTVQQIRQEEGQAPLAILISTDQFKVLDQWKDWEQLFNYAHLIVVNRPGYSFSVNKKLQAAYKQRDTKDSKLLSNNSSGYIFQLYIPPTTIAATDIRNKFEHGDIHPENLPDKVYDYILQNKLYREGSNPAS